MTVVPYLAWQGQTFAQDLTNRSVLISTATPSASASESFSMIINSAASVGSIVFQYCTNSPWQGDPCTPPAGLDVSGASLTQQTGNIGFSIDTTDSNSSQLVLTRPPAAAISVPSSYVFANTTNPSGTNQTVYVRLSTYASTDGTGSLIDKGSVAFSTQANFTVGAFVPPFIELCVGLSVAPDCSSASGDSIDLGVLSSKVTSDATSQYAAGTNDVDGYNTYLLGSTMTSGNNVIPSVTAPTPNRPSIGEFGLNLRKNNGPVVGQDPTGVGTAVPATDYNSPDLYSFEPGALLSSSQLSTDFNRMTASYIVNVDPNQPAGVYDTTLTYLATVDF
jgi:hypothetical protein